MLADIRNDLDEFGVHFDRWFSERELNKSGAVDRAIDALRASGHMYTKDGAEWFKSTDYGDDEDRVVIRANGEKTYFASDIAYHYDKRQRGHDLLIDGPGKYPGYNFWRVSGVQIGGKGKGDSENEQPPTDVRRLLP